MKKTLIYILPFLLFIVAGCKKSYLETEPSNAATEQEIFSKYTAVTAALGGIYKEQFAYGTGASTGHDNFGQKATDLMFDLMGNDMVVNTQGYGWFNTDYSLTAWASAATGAQSDNAWYMYYDIIKQANKLINNVDGVEDATADQKNNIKGQAYGLRAYALFYLINYFQQTYKGHESEKGVPIYTQDTTVGKARGSVQDVYDQIVSDLTLAEPLVTGKPRTDKTNIDLSVIQGLRARVALEMEDWATAADYATKAHSTYSLMAASVYPTRTAFSSVGNSECMWGSFIPEDQATIYASFFSHMDISTGGYAALGGQKKITKALYDQIPAGDVRKTVFTTPGTGTVSNPDYNQLKFQVPVPGKWAADYFYMTAAEMYLIEAEALERDGKDDDARTALETLVQTRYPAYSAAGLTGTALLNEILLQRRIELWGEGFSLWDIKRLGQGLNRPTGPGNHGAPNFDPGVYTTAPADPRFLMRVPQRELDNNINMTPDDQNP
jgi:hypothetical protein